MSGCGRGKCGYRLLAVILELNVQNLVTIPGSHTATDFFRPQLPRDLGIRQEHAFITLLFNSLPWRPLQPVHHNA